MGDTYEGHRSKIWYGKETSLANETTPDSYFGTNQSFNFDETNNIIQSRDIGQRTVNNRMYGSFGVTGTVNFQLANFGIFEIILGNSSGSGTGADPYVYTDDTTLPSTTIEAVSDITGTDQGAKMLGAKCNSASVNLAVDEIVTVDSDWVAVKPINISSPTANYTIPSQAPWTFVQGTVKRDGSSIGVTQNFTINIDNALIEQRGCGNRFIQVLSPGTLDLTYDCEVILDSDQVSTIFNDFYGQTPSSGPANGTGGAISGINYTLVLSDGANRSTTLTLSNCVVSDLGRNAESPTNFRTLSFSGSFDDISISEQRTA